jgi:hypothetical protein
MLTKLQYPSRGDWAIGNPIWSMALEYEDDDDYLNVDVSTAVVTVPADRDYYDGKLHPYERCYQ